MIRRHGTGAGFLAVLPMFHIFGCVSVFNAFALGGYSVTNPLFKKTMFLSSIQVSPVIEKKKDQNYSPRPNGVVYLMGLSVLDETQDTLYIFHRELMINYLVTV